LIATYYDVPFSNEAINRLLKDEFMTNIEAEKLQEYRNFKAPTD